MLTGSPQLHRNPPPAADLQLPARYQKTYAWLLSREDGLCDSAVGPKKEILFGHLAGTVLGLRPGSGENLRYYRVAGHWIGIEPNPHFHPRLQAKIRSLGISSEVLQGKGENIPAPHIAGWATRP